MKLAMGLFALLVSEVHATTWDLTTDYSNASNPNGAWTCGRKWSIENGVFDVASWRWGDSGTVPSGGYGWYMNNWGHGGPSFLDGDGLQGPYAWSKNNSNGIADVRWTSPAAGLYSFSADFTGADSRGVDNYVYVAVNDSLVFSGRITGDLDSETYSVSSTYLGAGDHIDFAIQWAGGVYSEYGWTEIGGTVSTIPEPLTFSTFMLASTWIALILARKRGKQASSSI